MQGSSFHSLRIPQVQWYVRVVGYYLPLPLSHDTKGYRLVMPKSTCLRHTTSHSALLDSCDSVTGVITGVSACFYVSRSFTHFHARFTDEAKWDGHMHAHFSALFEPFHTPLTHTLVGFVGYHAIVEIGVILKHGLCPFCLWDFFCSNSIDVHMHQ